MKPSFFAFLVFLSISFQSAPAATRDEEARFVAAARKAFDTHDATALAALTWWEHVSDKFKEIGRKQYAGDAARAVTDVMLTNPDPKFPDLVWKDKDGTAYQSNLPVIKQLKITFGSGALFTEATYPVGEKDGKLYLLESAPVR
jgi:hypothetical protein